MSMSSTLLFSLLMAASVCIGTSKSGHNDQCTIYQGGCKYRVALTHSECMSSDQPASHSGGESNFITHLVSGKPVIPVHPPEVNPMETNNIHQELPTERLDELEKKLTKMMEGLSVRSLRHIRQIRNDLRQLSESMSLLGTSNREGGSKRKRKAPEPTPPVSCPDEFSSVGTWASCYRFSTFNSTWHEAREYCSALGSNLVSLESLQESYILNYLIKSNPGYEIPKGWWTSGNYIARNHRWMWTTKLHLKNMPFARWAPGEPDSRSTMHCMLLYKHAAYRWHDAMCTDKHNFICEYILPK